MTRAKDGRDEPTTNPPPPPSYAYVHLERNCQLPNQRFFCDADQAVLAGPALRPLLILVQLDRIR
jgi:hypothetical protein